MTRFLAIALLCTAAVCRASAAEVTFQILDTKKAGLKDAVVSLQPLDRPIAASDAPPLEIVQQSESFHPYVTALQVGTRVDFANQDDVAHHVYSLSETKKFELPRYDPNKSASIVFDSPGVVVVGCNLHDWMLTFLVVLETPHFAQTDAAGRAKIADVPPGLYRAEVWHPRFPKGVTREVTVTADAPEPLAFELKLIRDPRKRRAPDGSGGSYR